MKTQMLTVVAVIVLAAASSALAQPDLIIEASPSIEPATPVAGDEFTVTVTVTNEGTEDASAFAIRLQHFPGGAGFVTVADHFNLWGLQAGATATYEIAAVLADAGSYSLFVLADPFGAVDESDEANNLTSVGIISVSVTTTDIAFAENPTINGGSMCTGNTVLLEFTITNQGNSETGDFEVSIYRVRGPGSIEEILRTWVYGLVPGITKPFRYPITVEEGLNRLSVKLDSGDLVEESNENNNYNFPHYSPYGVSAADLYVNRPPSLSQGTISPGAILTVSDWTVGNSCSEDAVFFQIGYYLSADDVVGDGDILLHVSDAFDLPSGALLVVPPVEVHIPDDAENGDYEVVLKIDILNNVTEIDEMNNTVKIGLVVPTEQHSWGSVKSMYH